MIIRRIIRKSQIRKQNKFVKKLCILFAVFFMCAGIFAVTLFTPVSAILCNSLYNSVMSLYNTDNRNNDKPFIFDLFHNNLSKTILNLSYPMINQKQFTGAYSTGSIYSISDSTETEDEDFDGYTNNQNIQNMPIDNDAPIFSVYEYYKTISEAKIEEVQDNTTLDDVPKGEYKITPVNFSGQRSSVPELLLNNQTSFNVNLNEFVKLKYPVKDYDINSDDPIVLIVCTHATESYCEPGTTSYSPPFTAERTSDINKNVVLIASELKNTLEKYGIPTIQSTALHDEVSYQNSYMRSLETMQSYIEQYPSIRYIIDIHRDSVILKTGEKYKPVISINEKNAAQVMMVVGTPDGGAYHPNWTENLTFAAYLQQRLNDKYPMLARPVNLRNARFNQHTTKGSIILEVGSCGNSFDEALYSAQLVGECLAELITEYSGD